MDPAERARADTWLASASPAPGLVVVGLPAGAEPSGAPTAPAAFRAALARLSPYDDEARRDLSGFPVADLGDWGTAGLDARVSALVEAGGLGRGPVAVFLGGDGRSVRHLMGALASRDRAGAGVLTLGAGADPEGLLGLGGISGRMVQVGARAFAGSAAGRATYAGQGIEVVTMETLDEVGAGWVVASALRDLATRSARVFVAVDLGVLDAAFAPGCPGSRPGGMNPRQLAAACRAAGSHPKVRAAAFGGVDPACDPSGLTVLNLATAFLAFASGVASREVPDA